MKYSMSDKGDTYYYGCDELFARHPDIVKRLIADAWRQMEGTEALNLPVMRIGFPKRIEWFFEFGLMSEAIHT